jgi:hypothetical protein
MTDKRECFEREFKKSLDIMGRVIDKMPEYSKLAKDREVAQVMGAAIEQHSKYYAKRMCGMKKHPLAGAPRRRRKSRK